MTDAPPDPLIAEDWQPLPPQARTVYMLVGALAAAPLTLVGGLGPLVASDVGLAAKIAGALALLLAFTAVGALLGRLRWRHARWKLDARGLQVRRGRFWRKEILVPRSRVQHLDLERGPIERRFGLATVVVHTAGTREHALRQSGLADADAVALRDALVPDAERHDDAL